MGAKQGVIAGRNASAAGVTKRAVNAVTLFTTNRYRKEAMTDPRIAAGIDDVRADNKSLPHHKYPRTKSAQDARIKELEREIRESHALLRLAIPSHGISGADWRHRVEKLVNAEKEQGS